MMWTESQKHRLILWLVFPLLQENATLGSLSWECHHRCVHRCALPISWLILRPIKVALKSDHHTLRLALLLPRHFFLEKRKREFATHIQRHKWWVKLCSQWQKKKIRNSKWPNTRSYINKRRQFDTAPHCQPLKCCPVWAQPNEK